MKAATSAWRCEQSGKNRFGQFGAWFAAAEIDRITREQHRADPDAFWLLAYLRRHNGPWSEFWIANGLAKTFGWGDKRLAAARERLLELGDVELVAPQRKHSPAIYQWPVDFQGRRNDE